MGEEARVLIVPAASDRQPGWALLALFAGLAAGFPLFLLAQSGPEPQPALSDKEKEEFLQNAEITGAEVLDIGITHSSRATLSDGRLVHDAHVQTVDFFKKKARTRSKTYFNWMEDIQDWCISRQIWWGHRIPAWYDQQGNFYVAADVDEVRRKQRAERGLKSI